MNDGEERSSIRRTGLLLRTTRRRRLTKHSINGARKKADSFSVPATREICSFSMCRLSFALCTASYLHSRLFHSFSPSLPIYHSFTVCTSRGQAKSFPRHKINGQGSRFNHPFPMHDRAAPPPHRPDPRSRLPPTISGRRLSELDSQD